MKALSIAIVVHVTDLEASLSYYIDVLGFTMDFRFGDYAGLLLDDVLIHLSGPNNEGQKKPPGGAHFCIDLNEIDDYYQLLQRKGTNITVAMADRIYGIRDFAVDDPDGNTIVFGMAI
ncbi:VOC family protein [Mucilaginibacter ximonensis]|uniref:VOC family protein n=1 Tax=Mucilaginibacter ximonensis TaxID=538021 RepID=A0ABW5YGX0_9SPHI